MSAPGQDGKPRQLFRSRTYVTRKEVLAAVGGHRAFYCLRRAGFIEAVMLPGYVRAHYRRTQIRGLLRNLPRLLKAIRVQENYSRRVLTGSQKGPHE